MTEIKKSARLLNWSFITLLTLLAFVLVYCRSWEVFEAINSQTALQYKWLAAVNNLDLVPRQSDGYEVDKVALEKVVLQALLFSRALYYSSNAAYSAVKISGLVQSVPMAALSHRKSRLILKD
jgi:hypothetical protein